MASAWNLVGVMLFSSSRRCMDKRPSRVCISSVETNYDVSILCQVELSISTLLYEVLCRENYETTNYRTVDYTTVRKRCQIDGSWILLRPMTTIPVYNAHRAELGRLLAVHVEPRE
jgi:hypothetical protein